MIVFTTVAFYPRYHRISYHLIDTFLKYVTDAKLLILTDDAAPYEKYKDEPNVHVIAIECTVEHFDLNIKYLVLQRAWEMFKPKYVICTDADAYFSATIDNSWFDELAEGVNLSFGYDYSGKKPEWLEISAAEFGNGTIREKCVALERDTDVKRYRVFREGCFIIKVNDQYMAFVEEWHKIFDEVAAKKLSYVSQIFEVQLACQRANFPLNHIDNGSKLRETIMMDGLNGSIGPAIM